MEMMPYRSEQMLKILDNHDNKYEKYANLNQGHFFGTALQRFDTNCPGYQPFGWFLASWVTLSRLASLKTM